MNGLSIYLMVGSIIAYHQIAKADEWHRKGIMSDEEYITHKYRKPKVYGYITLFWLPSLIKNFAKK